jgi:DNA gyrase subunit A
MLISDQGTLVRTHVNEVSLLGRNTQGVTLIRVSDKEKLVGLERICDPEDDEALLAVLADTDSVNTEASTGSEEIADPSSSDTDAGIEDNSDRNTDDNGDDAE